MYEYALIKGGVCVATGTLIALPDRPDLIERTDGVPEVGDVLQDGVWTTPEPEVVHVSSLTRVEFTERMTLAEQAAIYEAAETSPLVRVFVERLRMSEHVGLDDPRTIEGINALEAAGLIAVGRAAEILGK